MLAALDVPGEVSILSFRLLVCGVEWLGAEIGLNIIWSLMLPAKWRWESMDGRLGDVGEKLGAFKSDGKASMDDGKALKKTLSC